MSAARDSLFQSRPLFGRPQVTVAEKESGLEFLVGDGSWPNSARRELGPEEVAHLAHALNQWIARFTNNA